MKPSSWGDKRKHVSVSTETDSTKSAKDRQADIRLGQIFWTVLSPFTFDSCLHLMSVHHYSVARILYFCDCLSKNILWFLWVVDMQLLWCSEHLSHWYFIYFMFWVVVWGIIELLGTCYAVGFGVVLLVPRVFWVILSKGIAKSQFQHSLIWLLNYSEWLPKHCYMVARCRECFLAYFNIIAMALLCSC